MLLTVQSRIISRISIGVGMGRPQALRTLRATWHLISYAHVSATILKNTCTSKLSLTTPSSSLLHTKNFSIYNIGKNETLTISYSILNTHALHPHACTHTRTHTQTYNIHTHTHARKHTHTHTHTNIITTHKYTIC